MPATWNPDVVYDEVEAAVERTLAVVRLDREPAKAARWAAEVLGDEAGAWVVGHPDDPIADIKEVGMALALAVSRAAEDHDREGVVLAAFEAVQGVVDELRRVQGGEGLTTRAGERARARAPSVGPW